METLGDIIHRGPCLEIHAHAGYPSVTFHVSKRVYFDDLPTECALAAAMPRTTSTRDAFILEGNLKGDISEVLRTYDL
jgi:hypothetical protein